MRTDTTLYLILARGREVIIFYACECFKWTIFSLSTHI